MARTFSTRLFKAAPGPGNLPTSFNPNDGQSWLNAVAQASGSHKVTRWQGEGSPVQVTTEGGSTLSITPAGSEAEFLAQRDALVAAFEAEVGRGPSADSLTDEDVVFWETLTALYDAYQGPTLNADAVLGGIS